MESAIERLCVYVSFLFALQVTRLMDLIVHSLYSHKEVFLRELVRSVVCSACQLNFDLFLGPRMGCCYSQTALLHPLIFRHDLCCHPVTRVMHWIS
jgi:hypothetical protein